MTVRSRAPARIAAGSEASAIQSNGIAMAARIEAMNTYDNGDTGHGHSVVAHGSWA